MNLLAGHRFTVASYGPAAAYSGWLLRTYGADVTHSTALDPEGLGAFLGQGATFTATPDLSPGSEGPLITDIPVTRANRVLVEGLARSRPVTWITPWGLDNPWEARPATDLLLAAAGGWMSAVGNPGRQPLAPPGAQPRFSAGLFATIHALARGPEPGLAVVSAVEAVAATCIYDVMAYQMHGVQRQRVGHRFAATQPTLLNLPAKDGWVGIHAALHPMFVALCGVIGHPELVEDPRFSTLAARAANVAELDGYLKEWTTARSRWDAYHALQAARIPSSPIPNLQEVLDSPQLAARHFWSVVTTPAGRSYRVPGPPARVLTESAGGGSPVGPNGPWRPGALRVVDFSMGWAGPLVSHLLSCYGADVIKLEGPKRFDWWRGSRPPGDSPAADLIERSHVFTTVNRGKRGITLELTTPEGRELAMQLLASADVVVENFTATVMERLGFTYEELAARNPGLILVRQPGFGATGPEKDYLVFGNTIEGMSGLTSMIGYDEASNPFQMSNAFGDPISGLNGTIAVLAAVAARKRDGRGRCIEAAQLEGFLPMISDALVEYQRSGQLPRRAANRRPGAVISGVFPAAGDDNWVAIETHGPAGPLAGMNDDQIASWTSARPREEAVETLLAAGVPAAPLHREPDILSAEPFASSAFLEGLEREVIGFHLYPSVPVTSSGARPVPPSPAPLLGEHSGEVLAAMGVPPDGIEKLRSSAII